MGMGAAALTGGVAGLAAVAAGQAVQFIEDLSRAVASYANDAATAAAETSKMRLALAGVLGSEAPAMFGEIKQVVNDFNVPLQDATKNFTRFAASAKASGVSSDDIVKSFRGLIAANKALGGSQEQANGILLAATQVFGKGKLAAEELRGQIAERLPGAVSMMAQSMGISTAELDKRLEEGTVSVADFVKFTAEELGKFEGDAKKIADSPEEAGQRLATQLDLLQRSIGMLLAPIGAAFQTTFAIIVGAINSGIEALNRFLGLTPEAAVEKAQQALESRQRDLTNAIKGEGKLVDIGMQGSARRQTEAEARKELDAAIKTLNEARRRLGTGTGTIEQGKLVTAQDLIDNRTGNQGKNLADQLARIRATNARRLAEANANEIMKLDKQRFALLKTLRDNDARIAESQLTGHARAQLGILNTYAAQNSAIQEQADALQLEVDKAERKLKAAQDQLASAKPGADALRAQGLVDRAQAGLTGAQGRQAQFGTFAGDLRGDNLSMAIAQSTQGFRQRAEAAQKEADALRMRNRLAMEGMSDAEINRQLQLAEIERERADRIAQAQKENLPGLNDLMAKINEDAASAEAAINDLTEAQLQSSDALRNYVATSMEFLTNVRERIAEIAQSIEQSISQSIMGVVSGTMTASEAFANFFKSVGQSFMQLAAQMIAKLIVINLLKKALGGLFGGGAADTATDSFAGVNNDVLDSVLPANPYAKGGIVTKPTHALIGEGGMNEAVVPLPNGRSIPVDLGKNTGGGVTTNITVNVDQGGNTSTETDGDQANKLANAIDGAVKRVIMDERRVGGLLYNGRR
jgi:tape measure domain-containing protein